MLPAAVALSFLVNFFGIRRLIKFFHTIAEYQPIREARDGGVLVDHSAKAKTPTMAGLIMAGTIFLNIVLFADLTSPIIWGYIILLLSFAFVGFLDDLYKIYYMDPFGFQGSKKLIIQLIISALTVLLIIYHNIDYMDLPVFLPIINQNIFLGALGAGFFTIIITGSSNAANITDGLDGLLSMPVALICLTFIFIAAMDVVGIKPLPINLERETLMDILVILCSTATCFLSFLIFNFKPAKIFMGDVGSLFSGAILCYTAALLKIEFVYALMAALFICEILSSTLQAGCLMLTDGKKRIFKMAPFHHHLEKSGWGEKKIVLTLWGFCFLCCVLSLIMYWLCF
jgi:phospho-N-acetylmuramoyl-pentapeptide-transferase